MLDFVNFHRKILRCLNPRILVSYRYRFCHFESKSRPNADFSNPSSSSSQIVSERRVGIFWDLDNKPPKSVPPFNAAVGLKKAAAEIGFVRYTAAYANHHSFSYVPPEIRAQREARKTMNQLENMGVVKPDEPYKCRVCGRRFYTNERLINHFKQIHEREQKKRLNQIESARGKRRVKLVGKYSMKMAKFKHASRDVLTPKHGYGLADELKRAGFWVGTVSNKPQAADVALRDHMVEAMDKRRVDCVVLVSDDAGFAGVLREARERCLKTVVVGDLNDGGLKRIADASFSWREIMMGKAKKEAGSVVGRWRDRDVLKRLEWRYNPEEELMLHSDPEIDPDPDLGSDLEGFVSGEDGDGFLNDDTGRSWWEL